MSAAERRRDANRRPRGVYEPRGYARAKSYESRRGRARTVRELRAAPMQGAQDGARTVRGVARPYPPQGASEASLFLYAEIKIFLHFGGHTLT